jgi:hypothetical protein
VFSINPKRMDRFLACLKPAILLSQFVVHGHALEQLLSPNDVVYRRKPIRERIVVRKIN